MRVLSPLAAAVIVLGGCAHPLDVKVIDADNRAPIAGAQVARMGLKQPYFIVGAIVPKEERVTDVAGVAYLRDRSGMVLMVNAEGYEQETASIEPKTPSMTVELKRPAGGGSPADHESPWGQQ